MNFIKFNENTNSSDNSFNENQHIGSKSYDDFQKAANSFVSSAGSRNAVREYDNFTEALQAQTGGSLHDPSVFRNPLTREIAYDTFFENMGDKSLSQDELNIYAECLHDKCDSIFQSMANVFRESGDLVHTSNLGAITGMSLPVAKAIMMKNMFINTIPTMLAKKKIVQLSFEKRFLKDANGNEIDIVKQQDQIFNMIRNSADVKTLTVEKNKAVDAVIATGIGENEAIKGVTLDSVNVTLEFKKGEINPTTKQEVTAEKENITYDIPIGRYLNESYTGTELTIDVIDNNNGKNAGRINLSRRDNTLHLLAGDQVNHVKVSFVKDNANMSTKPPSIHWKIFNSMISIENSSVISTPYTLESAYDYNTQHRINIDELLIDTTSKVLSDYKDDYCRKGFMNDYRNTPDTLKVYREIDFAPSQMFAGTPNQWRQFIFSESLLDIVDEMARLVGDDNFEVNIYGRRGLIEKCVDALASQSDATASIVNNLGSYELEFSKTIIRNGTRKYNLIASQKFEFKEDGTVNDELFMTLKYNNPSRIGHLLLEYQTYLGPNVKTADAAHLNNITAFDRFELAKYEPAQAVVKILNPNGIRSGDTDAAAPANHTRRAAMLYGTDGLGITTVKPE